jgi:hypothetical protein
VSSLRGSNLNCCYPLGDIYRGSNENKLMLSVILTERSGAAHYARFR